MEPNTSLLSGLYKCRSEAGHVENGPGLKNRKTRQKLDTDVFVSVSAHARLLCCYVRTWKRKAKTVSFAHGTTVKQDPPSPRQCFSPPFKLRGTWSPNIEFQPPALVLPTAPCRDQLRHATSRKDPNTAIYEQGWKQLRFHEAQHTSFPLFSTLLRYFEVYSRAMRISNGAQSR